MLIGVLGEIQNVPDKRLQIVLSYPVDLRLLRGVERLRIRLFGHVPSIAAMLLPASSMSAATSPAVPSAGYILGCRLLLHLALHVQLYSCLFHAVPVAVLARSQAIGDYLDIALVGGVAIVISVSWPLMALQHAFEYNWVQIYQTYFIKLHY